MLPGDVESEKGGVTLFVTPERNHMSKEEELRGFYVKLPEGMADEIKRYAREELAPIMEGVVPNQQETVRILLKRALEVPLHRRGMR